MNHIKTVHEGQRDFPCPKCPQKFATKQSAKRHEKGCRGTPAQQQQQPSPSADNIPSTSSSSLSPQQHQQSSPQPSTSGQQPSTFSSNPEPPLSPPLVRMRRRNNPTPPSFPEPAPEPEQQQEAIIIDSCHACEVRARGNLPYQLEEMEFNERYEAVTRLSRVAVAPFRHEPPAAEPSTSAPRVAMA